MTVLSWKLLLLMLVFFPAMCSLLKENLERLMLCLLIAHCCCFLFLVAKSCWFSGTSSHCLPGNYQNLIILYRSIHPSTCLQSKFCDAFWVYWYKNQVIYAHVSYLAVNVPSCSCSSNAPSCLNSKTTICVSQISITAQCWSGSTHHRRPKYSWLQLCSVIQGIKNDCKIGKVPSIILLIMWI